MTAEQIESADADTVSLLNDCSSTGPKTVPMLPSLRVLLGNDNYWFYYHVRRGCPSDRFHGPSFDKRW